MAAYYFKFIGRPPVTGTPVGSRTVYFPRYELFSTLFGPVYKDDRQKVTHMSPPCKLHMWAQKHGTEG